MSLEALERSDLSRLPGGIFTRSFIRAYALEVGLDPDRTIQDFIAELPSDAATATAHPNTAEDGEKLESDRKAVTTALRLILVSVPIVAFVMYYGTQRVPVDLASIPQPILESQVEAAAPPLSSAPGVQAPEVAAAAPAVTAPISGLSMEIAPRASCWVAVNADGERVFSGVLTGGDKYAVTAKEQIVLNVGDAGAFEYTLNGRPGRALGAPGEVVSKRITLSNLNEFVSP